MFHFVLLDSDSSHGETVDATEWWRATRRKPFPLHMYGSDTIIGDLFLQTQLAQYQNAYKKLIQCKQKSHQAEFNQRTYQSHVVEDMKEIDSMAQIMKEFGQGIVVEFSSMIAGGSLIQYVLQNSDAECIIAQNVPRRMRSNNTFKHLRRAKTIIQGIGSDNVQESVEKIHAAIGGKLVNLILVDMVGNILSTKKTTFGDDFHNSVDDSHFSSISAWLKLLDTNGALVVKSYPLNNIKSTISLYNIVKYFKSCQVFKPPHTDGINSAFYMFMKDYSVDEHNVDFVKFLHRVCTMNDSLCTLQIECLGCELRRPLIK